MIHPAHQGDVQISDVDNAALCKGISEGLVNSLGPTPLEMPPHLMVLMRQLRDEPSNAVINLPSKVMTPAIAH